MKIKQTGKAVPRVYEEEKEFPETLKKYINGEIPTPEDLAKAQQELEEEDGHDSK